MVRRVASALWVLTASLVAACGLDRGGLLERLQPGDDSAIPSEGAVGDAISDDAADVGEAAEEADSTLLEAGADAEAGRDAPVDVLVDAPADVLADVPRDTQMDGPLDAVADTAADVPDSPADGPPDAPIDSAPPPSPIVWDGGAIPDPDFSDDDWVNVCVALVACGEMPGISACVALLHQPSSPDALIPSPALFAAILNAAPNCGDIATALGDGSPCASTTPDVCEGNSLVTCRWGFRMTVACRDLSMVCTAGSGNAGCGFGNCGAAQEGQTYCVGTRNVVACARGRYTPLLDCATFGANCIGPAGSAQCLGSGGTSCLGGQSCVGDSVVDCLGGLLGSVDCTAAFDPSFTCIVDANGEPTCAADTACEGASATDDCANRAIVDFCNAGTPDTFDCRSNGYADCSGGRCRP